ncbi:MAG: hypothetical protein JXN65_03930 [Clostridia bacterium]|nr:hypothetical protein [Clostridia bacterium]
MKKYILLFLAFTLLFTSCQKENEKYTELNDDITAVQNRLSDFELEIDKAISESTSPYDTLISLYIERADILIQAECANQTLESFKDEISEEEYTSASDIIFELKKNISQSIYPAEGFYTESVTREVALALSEYEMSGIYNVDKLLEIYKQADSLNLDSVLQIAALQGQKTMIGSFIACSQAYTEWTNYIKEFAEASLSSTDKQASKALVEEYLEQTNKYYGIHISALDSVSLLDTASNENADDFISIFSSYSSIYEDFISSLEEILEY